MNKYFKQEEKWTCGPACARMMLYDLGIELNEYELCERLDTISLCGTRSDSWGNLSDICEVCIGEAKSLEDLEDLRKGGWELSLMVDADGPHYIRYIGQTTYKVLYFNPYHSGDTGMRKDRFLKCWYLDTDDYFEVGVLNCSRLVLDKWYVGLRKKED